MNNDNDKKTISDWAFEYNNRVWSVIPIRPGTKKPATRWKKYQKQRPNIKQLTKWFGNGKPSDIAVICGAVSGNLAILDFDKQELCNWWNNEHPDLASTFPTVKTKKGLHIYFRYDKPFRKQNGDGVDLLCEGSYAVLPPSQDKTWLRPVNGEIPFLNPFDLGLECFGIKKPGQKEKLYVTEQTETTKQAEQSEAIVISVSSEKVINETLPQSFGTRNRQIFEFARAIKSFPQFADAKPQDFRSFVVEWHKKALPNIRTKEFEETWIDFLKAWPKIKYSKGKEPIMQIFERAIQFEPPKIADEKYPNHTKLKILVSLCKELQRAAGQNPFFLSVRTAGKLLNISPMQASRWFFLLESDGILRVVSKGGTPETVRQATRYRYVEN